MPKRVRGDKLWLVEQVQILKRNNGNKRLDRQVYRSLAKKTKTEFDALSTTEQERLFNNSRNQAAMKKTRFTATEKESRYQGSRLFGITSLKEIPVADLAMSYLEANVDCSKGAYDGWGAQFDREFKSTIFRKDDGAIPPGKIKYERLQLLWLNWAFECSA